ncbi:MAG: AraC family transcriptional regulator [Victivallaceae bacterium]|nr:AraC family transcriptional regulator [Victivallaceae bacterium]
MKRRYVSMSDGESKLWGYNFGKYPKHNFLQPHQNVKIVGNYPIQILATGYDEWHKECFRQRINSDTFAVEYVTEGIFLFCQENIMLRVSTGEIFLVQVGMDNSMRCETETATKRTVIMTGSLLKHSLELMGLSRVSRIIPSNQSKIDVIFDRLHVHSQKDDITSYREGCKECYALLMELSAQNVTANLPQELLSILEFMHEHLSEHLTLAQMARHIGVSEATLYRLFRKYLKTSPVEYYLEQKIERAATLLRQHIYSVKEIAMAMNYSSPQYFATEFKRHFGITPKQIK